MKGKMINKYLLEEFIRFTRKTPLLMEQGLKVLKRDYIDNDKLPSRQKDLRSYSTSLGLAGIAELEKWTPVTTKKTSEGINVIDIFSGCGGMSLGFEAISSVVKSFNIIGALDINKQANATYKANFGINPTEKDIGKVASSRKEAYKFLDNCQYNSKFPLVLIGCAPCQGFTSHRKKVWETQDSRNSLVENFAKLASFLNPDVVIMENVPELLSQKYWNYFETARKILIANGYHVRQSIYNCAAFGVPQERFRSLVMAMKKDFAMPQGFLVADRFITVKEAIGDLPHIKAGERKGPDVLHVTADHREETIKTIKLVPKNGGNRPSGVGPKCLDKIKGFSDVYGRLSWNRSSITVTHYARNPASGRYVHPQQNRGLSGREAARLQSFPDGFIFEGTFDGKFSQIGNAVPPRFSSFVAAQVLCELLSCKAPELTKRGPEDIISPVSSSYSSVIATSKLRRDKAESIKAILY